MSRISILSAGALAAFAAPLFAQTTIRVTSGLGGAEPNGDSEFPFVSGDGRFVAFSSVAENLAANDTNVGQDAFLFDTSTGTIELVSVREPGPSSSLAVSAVSVSDDGNIVVFASAAPNLGPGSLGWSDILVRDRVAGTTTRLTTGWNGHSGRPALTPDGRYIAFESFADNVVAGGADTDVFLHDRQMGSTVLVSRNTAGTPGNSGSTAPAISADGLTVAFRSSADNLAVGDLNSVDDIFVHEVQTGSTQRVSLNSFLGELNSTSRIGNISGDGRRVLFVNAGNDVTSGDADGLDDVFFFDRAVSYPIRASTPASQVGGNGVSDQGSISRDGRYVVFRSTGTDLVPSDPTPVAADLYVKDTQTGAVEVVSLSSTGTASTSADLPSISADGRFVAFRSLGSLVPGDANGFREIYVRDRGALVYTTPCAGDGSSTACPCGNPGSPGNGCENYAISGGVRLSATGSASITSDTLHLSGTGFLNLPTPLGFVQGDALLNGGQGVPFGDGVQCVGGSTVRFGRRNALNTSVAFGAGVAGDAPVSVVGHVDTPGVTRYYQIAYFNFGSFCGQLRRNWSNSIAVVWAP